MYLFYLKSQIRHTSDLTHHFKRHQQTETSPAACDAARRFVMTRITENLHPHKISQSANIQPTIVWITFTFSFHTEVYLLPKNDLWCFLLKYYSYGTITEVIY